MIVNFFGEGESFPHQAGNSLTHRIVEPLDMICFSALFIRSTMPAERKNSLISGPEIRVADGTLTVNARQRVPEALRTFLVATSVPPLVNYQGMLTDASGKPLTGMKKLEFNLYDTAIGGSESKI